VLGISSRTPPTVALLVLLGAERHARYMVHTLDDGSDCRSARVQLVEDQNGLACRGRNDLR
jgi:hypothetical protein